MLRAAKVLVVGAGGLGCPVLTYLNAAGIGTLGIIDGDHIDLTNLQRQILYSDSDISKSKTAVAREKLNAANPHTKIKTYPFYLNESNALDIIRNYDLVVDGTDNFATRYLVNDACVILEKPNVYGSIFRYEGQVAIFNYLNADGTRGPNYRDLYPSPPDPDSVPDCATGGVLGVLPGIVGTLQALEVIKLITGIGEPLAGRLLLVDCLSMQFRNIKLDKISKVSVEQLINYEDFCGAKNINKTMEMKEITATELNFWRDSNKDFQLVDVREQNERDFVSIGGTHIPLGDIVQRAGEVDQTKDVVLMCRSGKRSAAALQALQQHGYTKLFNLKGGILAWVDDVDPSLPRY